MNLPVPFWKLLCLAMKWALSYESIIKLLAAVDLIKQ